MCFTRCEGFVRLSLSVGQMTSLLEQRSCKKLKALVHVGSSGINSGIIGITQAHLFS